MLTRFYEATSSKRTGDSLRAQGRPDEAEKIFRESLRLDPNDAFVAGGLALIERPLWPVFAVFPPTELLFRAAAYSERVRKDNR